MTPDALNLRRRAIYMAAAQTTEVEDGEQSVTTVDRAVVSLARAVFAANGRLLILTADADLIALAAQIATEYFEPGAGTYCPLVFPQSAGEMPDIYTTAGYVETWTDREQLRVSPRDPLTLVCMGGQGQVAEFATWFHQRFANRRIYTLASTGGDAERLLRDRSPTWQINDIEQQLEQQLSAILPVELMPAFPPYPLLMQIIVKSVTPSEDPSLW